jgi:hypothetical protein
MVGPSSGSAVSNHFGSCWAQKYGPKKISCRQAISARSPAASSTIATCFASASSFGRLACA